MAGLDAGPAAHASGRWTGTGTQPVSQSTSRIAIVDGAIVEGFHDFIQ